MIRFSRLDRMDKIPCSGMSLASSSQAARPLAAAVLIFSFSFVMAAISDQRGADDHDLPCCRISGFLCGFLSEIHSLGAVEVRFIPIVCICCKQCQIVTAFCPQHQRSAFGHMKAVRVCEHGKYLFEKTLCLVPLAGCIILYAQDLHSGYAGVV